MPKIVDDIASEWIQESNDPSSSSSTCSSIGPTSEEPKHVPKRFEVVGDVALLHSMPECETDQERESIGNAILSRNKAIKIVAVRSCSLSGSERSAGDDGIQIIAGVRRSPLITSHMEYGIKCIVDLNHVFFSTRMGPERLRICQQVARGENVLVLFSGVGMDAMQIAARTEATVTAVELNPIAVECARRGQRMLVRNKTVKCTGAAERLSIVQGDALDVMTRLPKGSFDRILAPRPKEGNLDGDLGTGDGGIVFLKELLPLLKDQGECHWYDFAADHELPQCLRTQSTIEDACRQHGFEMEVIHVAHVGSIAKRQVRICMDFRVVNTVTCNTKA
jgi:tRNA G37 N-methylase Trm5